MQAAAVEVVLLSTADWNAPVWTNKQYVGRELATGYDVLYVESLGLRRPELSARDLRRLVGRFRAEPACRPDRSPPARLRVVTPNVVPFHRGALRRLNSWYMRRFWRRHLPAGGRPRVLWTFSPLTYGAEDHADVVVYHCVDLLGEQSGVDPTLIRMEEERLAGLGARAIGSSGRVCEHLRERGFTDVLEWPNVAETGPFLAAAQPRTNRRPTVVFGGNLSPYKLDVCLLEKVAVALAGRAELVMAGPWAEGGGGSVRGVRRLESEGVRFAGNLSIEELAKLYGSATVGIIPYQLNPYTDGVDPLKTFEYLAAGLRVVATPLPSLRDRDAEFIVTATGPEFVRAVLEALEPPTDDQISARMARARASSWEVRGETARSLVADLEREVRGRDAVRVASAAWPVSEGPDVPSVDVAVVTHGDVGDACGLIASLVAQGARLRVAIVHNGPVHHSGSDLIAELEGLCLALPSDGGSIERLLVADAGRNLGYAAGLNLAVAQLRDEREPGYVWLLNPDVVLDQHALRHLLAAAEREPAVWCWGSTHLGPDEQVRVAGFVELGLISGRRRPRRMPHPFGAVDEVEVVSPRGLFIPGSAMFMPLAAFDSLGGLSESYFMYFEEIDLSERIHQAGHPIGWACSSRLAHAGKQSTRDVSDPARFVARHSTRSHLQFLREHRPPLVMLGIAQRLGHAALAALRHDVPIARGTLEGLADASPWGRRG